MLQILIHLAGRHIMIEPVHRRWSIACIFIINCQPDGARLVLGKPFVLSYLAPFRTISKYHPVSEMILFLKQFVIKLFLLQSDVGIKRQFAQFALLFGVPYGVVTGGHFLIQ